MRWLLEDMHGGGKDRVRRLVRRPQDELAASPRLRAELAAAEAADAHQGPRHDAARHAVGVEFEELLHGALHALAVPFETEQALRDRGLAKTPDVLLEMPLGVPVDGAGGGDRAGNAAAPAARAPLRVVNWIDSKAMFGDARTFREDHLPQLRAYVHRHGPGAVIYWFDFAQRVREVLAAEEGGELLGGVLVLDRFPTRVVLPGGETLCAEFYAPCADDDATAAILPLPPPPP